MLDRKQLKKSARATIKRHYILLAVVCAISIFFLGTEFSYVTDNAQNLYSLISGRSVDVDEDSLQENDSAVNKIIDDLLADNIAAGQRKVAERIRALRNAKGVDSALARQKGVLASLVNTIHSGNLFMMLAATLNSVFHSGHVVVAFMILGSALLYALIWVFLRNTFQTVLRRVFLEARTYEIFPINHVLHIKSTGRWARVSLTLLLQAVLQYLWILTIVGGVIKHYSYFLTPYIAAENPDIKPREAINLSRRMMNGHKWECFKLELTFLGWDLLGILTFGAVNVLWSTPYRIATCAEFYAALRSEAREKGIEGAALLNDDNLFAPADEELLKEAYSDIVRYEGILQGDIVPLTPRQRFFAHNFGVWTGTLAEKRIYSRQAGLRQQARLGQLEMTGRAYPERLNPLWNHHKAELTGKVSYLAPCTVWTLIAVFFAFCIVGWVWEVSLHLITHGEFVNRGSLHGPWLPIYGSGVVMICVLLYRLRSKPLLEIGAIIVLCGFVEYMTSFVMERMYGMRWWDYSGYFLNLNGRICGEGLAVFALGGMVAVYFLVPIIDALVMRAKPRALACACVALMALFTADMVYSHFVPNAGAGITSADDASPEEPQPPDRV